MKRFQRIVAGGAVIAVALTALPATGQAGLWPWSKRGERAAERAAEEQLPLPVPPPPAADAQVFEPAPAPADSNVFVAAPTDLLDRLATAEAKVRELNGQVEELTFQLRQLEAQFHEVQADNEYRLQELESNPAPSERSSATPPPDVAPAAPIAPPVDTAKAPLEPQTTGSTLAQPLGGAMIDSPAGSAQDQPLDLSAINQGIPAQSDLDARPVPASLGDPTADYNQGYEYIMVGDYQVAEVSFRHFLASYPADARAADAQYWLGESLFQRGNYRDAADEFLAGYKQYPQSPKAPDTLLKLGLSLAGLGEREAACSTYAEALKKYPEASNALRQRVAAEQAIARC